MLARYLWNSFFDLDIRYDFPEGSDTQYLRFLVPKATSLMILKKIEVRKYLVLDCLGLAITTFVQVFLSRTEPCKQHAVELNV